MVNRYESKYHEDEFDITIIMSFGFEPTREELTNATLVAVSKMCQKEKLKEPNYTNYSMKVTKL